MSRTIAVPSHLVRLLHLRTVWGIPGPSGLPAANPPTCAPESLPVGLTVAEASDAWDEFWNAGINWQEGDSTSPPAWQDRFGLTGLEDRSRDWVNRQKTELHGIGERGWSDVHLRTVLDDAEARGVHDYVLLPLAEPWSFWTSDRRVVMSGSVFADETLLRQFTQRTT